MRGLANSPPAALRTLLAIIDPGETHTEILIPDDLLARHPEIDRGQLRECHKFLNDVLAPDATPNADLKGMLNRLAGHGAWGVPFDFGGDAKAARRFLDALRAALSRKLI